MKDARPDPDALLALAREEEERARRGRLKIFFGATAGVGKTFAMLQGAQELRRRGADVVVGWAETHGRKETEALLPGLEILLASAMEHRGITLREFDLDGAVQRRPAVLLVDDSPTPTRPARGTPSAGRTSKRSWPPASRCGPRSMFNTWRA